MTALIALIRKDLILFLSNRRAMMLNLLMPILLGGFFGFITGGRGERETAKIDIAVVQLDTHPISLKIAEGLKSEPTLHVEALSLEEATTSVRKGQLHVAVVLPAGFGEQAGAAFFSQAEKPVLPVYYDPSQSAVLAMVKGMLTQQVMQSVSAEMFNGKQGIAIVDQSIQKLDALPEQSADQKELRGFLGSLKKFQEQQQVFQARQAAKAEQEGVPAPRAGLTVPFSTKDEAMTAGDPATSHYNGYAHSFAGMSVQFILFMAIDAGIGVLVARRMGLWNRLLAAPVGMNTLILARAISCAVIASGLLAFIFAIAFLVFKVSVSGSLPGFVGIALAFAMMAASFGLLIAAFGKTPEAARGISIFATLIMVMLSGAWMPAFLFPQWLQDLTLLIPTRWAVDGFDAMTWRGLDWSAALPAIGVQLLFTLMFGAVALWKFRQQQADI